MNREPVLTVGSITAAVTAALGLLVAFKVNLSTEQQTAVLVATAALAPVVAALVSRRKVTPV